MPFVAPASLLWRRKGKYIQIESPSWSVVHDLSQGGAPVEIKFAHGQPGNLLVGPLRSGVDSFFDTYSPDSRLRTVGRIRGGIRLVFEGSLADRLRTRSNVRFRTTSYYTPYWILREVRLSFPLEAKAKRVRALHATFDGRLSHWSPVEVETPSGARLETGEVPGEPETFYKSAKRPLWISLFRPGGEGFQILPGGDLSAWDALDGGGGKGHYCLSRLKNGIRMELVALRASQARPMPQELTFTSLLTLVNFSKQHLSPYRTVMVGNPPFPPDELLQAWSESGVELIVIMEGAAWFNAPAAGTDRFWRTGRYPCYEDREDMADMDRMIRSAHRYGLRIIPYTCPTELHPEMPTFAKHIGEWHRASNPRGHVLYNRAGKMPGGLYGAGICPESRSWRTYYLRYVKTLLENHEFDGVYLDGVSAGACWNEAHGAPHHSDLAGLTEILLEVRRLLGAERLMVVHNADQGYLALSNNLADMVVTFEAWSWFRTHRYDLKKIHQVIRAYPATRVALVPCSTWYSVPAPEPKQAGLQDGIAKALLLGTIPYSYAMWEHRWGYKDPWACLRDPWGIYAAYRKLRDLRLGGLHFEDCFTAPFRCNRHGVLGARYRGLGREIILVVNISERTRRDIFWRCGEASGRIRRLRPNQFRFIEVLS